MGSCHGKAQLKVIHCMYSSSLFNIETVWILILVQGVSRGWLSGLLVDHDFNEYSERTLIKFYDVNITVSYATPFFIHKYAIVFPFHICAMPLLLD